MKREIPLEQYEVRNYCTEDIEHDLKIMLVTFGPDDPDVKEYQAELDRRNGEMEKWRNGER
jgi:hypothetical protein